MKRTVLLTILLSFACLLSAQNVTVTVSGSVIDENGQGVEGITMTIFTDSTAVFPGYFNQVQTDADGHYTDSFSLPDNLTQGIVWVSMENCDNSIVTQSDSWFPGGDPVIDFDYCANIINDCSVNIVIDSIGGINGVSLYASVAYSGSITYAWNNGATTQSTIVTQSGTYCVTITDATGCTDSDCIEITVGSTDSCGVSISPTAIGGIGAWAQGIAPFTYSWNTGDTTELIFPTQDGTYCVTVVDAEGCTAIACYDYYNQIDTICSVYINFGSTGG